MIQTLGWAHAGTSALAAFLASLVECVEALTVVLAVGTVRGWRGALAGSFAALLVLLALVLALGPGLARIPIQWVQVAIGLLTLLFGLRWLRKAILRGAGLIPLHDEAAAYAKESAALRRLGGVGRGLDRVAVSAAFQIVMLEGVEVVFIVIAIGAGDGRLASAAVGAIGALLLVMALGLALHRPMAMIPENALKFVVGVLLSAFGTFWVGEGIGAAWPGADWSLPVLVLLYLATALGCVQLARQGRPA